MVRRRRETAFMAGAYVFPGGGVDDADRDADEQWCDGVADAIERLWELEPADAVAQYVAGLRELFEEAGVLLARTADRRFVSLADADAKTRFTQYRADVHAGSHTMREIMAREELRLALDALVPWSHWVTPPIGARRFDTWFFVAAVPPDQTPAHDERETIDSVWMTAAEAIARCQRNEIVLPPPTWTTLRELEAFASADAVIASARGRRIVRREPKVLERDGTKILLLPGDPWNPETPVEAVPVETRFILADGRWRAERPPTLG